MQLFVITTALLHICLCDHVAIRMPYLNPAGVTYVNNLEEAPLAYTSAASLQPVVPATSAQIETHHVGYASAQVPAVAAVSFVKHVPTISQVPVTTIEAQPGLIQKQVDVLKPAIATRKVEKHFYDIEERVIIRPVGSAVLELDEPTSKIEKGPAVIKSLTNNLPLVYPHTYGIYDAPTAISHIPAIHATSSPLLLPSSTPASITSASNNLENESIIVENPDFRSVNQAHLPQLRTSKPRVIAESPDGTSIDVPIARFAAHDPSPTVIPSQKISAENSKINQNRLIEFLTARGGVAELWIYHIYNSLLPRVRIKYLRSYHVMQLGFSRDDTTGTLIEDAGHVRARILSATPVSKEAEPTGERVSTRRVVVSRPIETFQEYDILEPATKIETVSVQHPTLIKTARVDHVQVHGSVPIIGKAFTPAVAHAAVPVYQKTISSTF
ncbi:PREDICTED: uncharacterized protein LOC105563502 isoform X2 [Vollenhovia emeryi]|uniref:uncharacterized protein LOC105563502 isoform X2 n=1 Tax=Vollenhovia emeryi TaxID=411798 RepID=UPI0005F3633A|nr:PREDICTED: uncharacterized protein LOC105563502 isoform X2 [Vollenhovia emeryi]